MVVSGGVVSGHLVGVGVGGKGVKEKIIGAVRPLITVGVVKGEMGD
jgi:hypothetical protein